MPPKSEAQTIRALVIAECDRLIALGPSAPAITVDGIAEAIDKSRSVIYKHKLGKLIRDKAKEQRATRSRRDVSRDETIARLQRDLAKANEHNDRLRGQLLLMEEAARRAHIPADTLYDPVDLPSRTTPFRGTRATKNR